MLMSLEEGCQLQLNQITNLTWISKPASTVSFCIRHTCNPTCNVMQYYVIKIFVIHIT